MLPCIVLQDLKEILLGMRSDLDNVLRLDILFDQFPITAMFLQRIQKRLMFFRRPQLAVLCNDVRLARLLCGQQRLL